MRDLDLNRHIEQTDYLVIVCPTSVPELFMNVVQMGENDGNLGSTGPFVGFDTTTWDLYYQTREVVKGPYTSSGRTLLIGSRLEGRLTPIYVLETNIVFFLVGRLVSDLTVNNPRYRSRLMNWLCLRKVVNCWPWRHGDVFLVGVCVDYSEVFIFVISIELKE